MASIPQFVDKNNPERVSWAVEVHKDRERRVCSLAVREWAVGDAAR